jgi:hypothetical protein
MQQTGYIDRQSGQVNRAEDAVTDSIARFETAMEHLAGKVEDTTHRVQHIVEIAQRPVQDLRQLKDRLQQTATPLIEEVGSNPRPWIMTGIFLGAAYLFFNHLNSNRRMS